MNYIDLHTHSTYSDGTFTPEEIFALAKQIGLQAVALTDHDTLNGLAEAAFYAKKNQLQFIPGIELVTEYQNKKYHIVGLCFQYTDGCMQNALDHFICHRRDMRNQEIADKLNHLGAGLSLAAIKAENPTATITRAHFANALVKEGFCRTSAEAFQGYLDDGGAAYVKWETLTPAEVIGLIHDSKGVAILAHPTLYQLDYRQIEEVAKAFSNFGLDGIEAYYTRHTNEDTAQMLSIAHRLNLLVSGGSDFHGENKVNTQLGFGQGNLRVPHELLEKIMNRSEMYEKE